MAEHAEDIHFYVSNQLRISNGPLRDDLRLELVERSQAVFLWVVLVVRRLNEEFDEGTRRAELLEVVRSLPTDLRDLLHNIVSRRTTDERLFSALTWTLFAQYSLNIRELYYAIQLSMHQFKTVDMTEWCCHDEFVDDDLEHMQRFALSACRGLVEIKHLPRESLFGQRHTSYLYKSSGPFEKYDDAYFDHLQVQFIHETVREYLVAEGLATLHPELQLSVAPKSHALIVGWCVLWIKSAASAYTELREDSSSKPSGTLVFDGYPSAVNSKCDWSRFPLFAYVRYATFNHLSASYLEDAICTADLQDFPTDQWIDMGRMLQHNRTLTNGEEPYADTASLLYFLLQGGFRDCVKRYLESLAQPSSKSEHPPTFNGLAGSAERDIGRLLNVRCGGRHFSCLELAAYRGYSDMVQLLLDHGAEPNVQSRSYNYGNGTITDYIFSKMIWSPWELAGRVQRSLIRGFSISGKRLTELMSIVSSREISALDYISILLKFGANPNADYIEHDVDAVALILWIASIPEDTQTIVMARMFLQAGAEVDATNLWNETALILASYEGNKSMVRLLLDFGANVNHRSQRIGGYTAIEAVQAMNDSGQQYSRYYDGFSRDFGGIIEMLLEARAHDERVPGG